MRLFLRRNTMTYAPALFTLFAIMMSATPVMADFTFPESCPTGTGTYSGDITGGADSANWEVVTELDGSKNLHFILRDDIADRYESGIIKLTLTSVPVDDDGGMTFFSTSNTQNVLTVMGQFEDCVMSGTWKLTIDSTGEELNGSYSMSQGPLPSDNALCGAAGASMAPMMLAGLCFLQRRGTRRPRRHSRTRTT